MSSTIKKKSGKLEPFIRAKIHKGIKQAMKEVRHSDHSEKITEEVVKFLNKRFKDIVPTVHDIKDVVEDILIKHRMHDVAKAYILHRKQVGEGQYFSAKEEGNLSVNAITVLQKRYLRRNIKGEVVETTAQMFSRVAKHVASAEKKKDKNKWEEEFLGIMEELDFLPNTPCLINAGTSLNQLFSCFVLDVPDSMEEIFETLKQSALIFKSGGGVGYSFSNIRHSGALVNSTGRTASGPVTFMEVYDKATEVIKKGGVRRGSIMGVLRVDHPDILTFVGEKAKGKLPHFNVSVGVTDEFMKAVVNDRFYWLKDNKGKNVQHVRAREVFDFICGNAWESGDPGLLFIDEINRKHPLKKVGKVEATNPCGEVILLPNEACCLGSVNLAHMVRNNAVNWVKLAKTVKTGVRFLDNMITLNNYPTKDIKKICLSNRKIGLGVMGWANMLVSLNLKYDSSEALAMAKKVATFIRKTAEEESEKLAREKGAFPNQKNSTIKNKRRNATILSISPTGSISIIAGCSSGIEPLFGIAYVRNIVDGMQLFEVNPAFEQVARYRGFYSKGLMTKISHLGSIQDIKKIPKDVQDLFVTALDIPVESHVKMQAVFQSQIDNAVSKTVNLPTNAIIGDIKRTYMLAWKEKCKGITVYRYGSKGEQVLYIGAHDKKGKKSMPHTKVHAEYSGGHISKTCEY